MKKIFTLFLLSLIIGIFHSSMGQTIFLEEGFENEGSFPTGWTQEKETGDANWDFFQGGALPPGGDEGYPPSAHSGEYNARFYKSSFFTHTTYLISPAFSFEFAQKPELKFWYAQVEDQLPDGDPDNNKFKIFYRTPEEGNQWFLLKEYNAPTLDWVYDSLPIPDSITNKKYKSIQLGFYGISSTVGYGSCIDDILLIETDTVTKYIEKVYASQPIQDIIPSGSLNNSILRLRFPVQGNDGALILDSLVVTATENTEQVVAPNGVKLFHTTTEYFSSTDQIGASTSFVDGKAYFTNINHELPFGNSYVWVTYDIPQDTEHIFKGFKVDAKIETNSIKVNNSYFPLSELNPSGYREISESVFFDNFENGNNWTLTGEFEQDTARGLGGFYQNSDPDYAKSGFKILGTDISGLGTRLGDYEPGISSNAYTAVTANFNCTYYKNLNLQFYRWLNVNFGDTAAIDYSLDEGATWNRVWNNSSLIAENIWRFQQLSLSTVLDRSENVTLRFTLGPTGVSQFLSGWNIDDFALTGTYVNDDVGVSALLTPNNGCGHVAPEVVEVTIKNYGFDPTKDTIPVGYSIDNGASWTKDTLFVEIPQNGSENFEFSELVDFTAPGYHQLKICTFLEGDEDNRNNTLDTQIFVSPTYTLPYSENFESNNGFWKAEGTNNTWEYGSPSGSTISAAFSGENCWATKLAGNYTNNDSAWIESPCFNFNGTEKPILDFMLYTDGEINNDGLAVYYTINDGISWQLVPLEGSFYWNWYNNANIPAFNHAAWDSLDNKWINVRQILPNDIANQASIKFRFIFMSNESVTKEGFAVDDIRIYDAPTDAGVFAFIEPVNSCTLSKTQEITVAIKNYGIRKIMPQDTLFASVVIDNTITLSDTFTTVSPILVDGTANFTFSETTNMFNKKWYNLKAYTQVKGDTAYYVENVYNDTLVDSVYVKGEPYYSLGPDIGTLNADTVILDGKIHYVGGAPFSHYYWKYEQKTDSTGIADDRYFGVPSFPTGMDYIDFTIEVINDSTCSMKDTIQIIKSNTDIGVSAISGLTNKCIDNQNQALQFEITNYTSGYTMVATTEVTVGYIIENYEEVVETFTLDSDLLPSGTVTYNFVQQPVFSLDGNQTLTGFTVVTADLDYSNDTLSSSIDIYPIPDVNIGPDSILTLQGDSITFNAKLGFATYTWQDNSTDSLFTVPNNLTNTYSVTVTDINACGSDADSVLITSDNWILDSLVNPYSRCNPSSEEQLTILLINKSPNSYPSGYSIAAKIIFNGITYNEPIILPEALPALDSITYTFTTLFDMSEPKEYSIRININPVHDINRSDNYLYKKINIWGIKKVDLGPDTIITRRADTILLDAGSGFKTYKWQDGKTDQSYQIQTKTSDTYWVSVTDYNGCPSSNDTVHVISLDLSVEELTSPESQCDISDINSIVFTLRNTSPDIIPLGKIVNIYYAVDDNDFKLQVYSLPFDLHPDQTKTITLTEEFNFENNTTYDFLMYIETENDFYNENDTLKSIIYQLEHPTVNLGADIYTSSADTVVLKAQKGYTNYKWQDDSRKDSLAVTKNYSAEYWVRVGNAYGCYDRDTLNIYTYDIGISSFGNLNNCEVSANNVVTLNIQLNSQDTLHVGDKITASYEFNSIPVTEIITLTDTFTNAAVLPYSFNTPFTVSDTGNFSLSASVEMTNEVVTNNNDLSVNFRIGAYPVNLGNDIVTYESSVILDAHSGFTSYLWNNDSIAQTLEVTAPGKYSVTTTDANNCTASDSINVLFLNPGYEITEITGLYDSCAHATNEIIEFKMQNTGNDTLISGSIIPISYQINSLDAIEEDYTFTQNLIPGNSVSIAFTTRANLSNAAAYSILTAATIGEKTTSLDSVVTTWPAPVVDLGDDIQSPVDSVILDAGAGFASYLWTTDAETQTIEVRTDGDYGVTVTNSNGCINSDMINVHFIPASLFISKLVNPLLGCESINNEKPTIIVKNGGSRIIPVGTSLIMGFQVDDEVRINETNELETNFPIDALYTYEFKTPLLIENTNSFNISFFVKIDAEDMDTLTQTIPIYEKPIFFDGSDTLKTNDYPYVIDPNLSAESYLWNTNETTPTISVDKDGKYWLTITMDNTCSFTDSVYVKIITGIHNSWTQQISVYPNPGEKEVWVDLPENAGKVTLQVTDLNGKIIFFEKGISADLKLDISTWDQGIYILRINNAEQYGIYQIIKQ